MTDLVSAAQEAALARIDRSESESGQTRPHPEFDRLRADVESASGEVDPIEACRLAAAEAEALAADGVEAG